MSFYKHLFKTRFYLTCVFLIFTSGCITAEYDVSTHRQNIFLYSVDKEVALGKNIAKGIEKELKISKNPQYIERINRIGSKIVKVCDRQEINYYFYVIDKKNEYNAFSIPGGYVYVFKNLMDDLNDDELAFVVAHEIGHIVARHAIKKLQAAMGMNLLVLASTQAEANPGFQKGLSFALAQIMVAYSREDEYTADELATKYIKMAGYNPKAGINVLNKLYQQHKKEPLREYSYFRTHPYVAQRISHIKEYLGIPLDVNDYINN